MILAVALAAIACNKTSEDVVPEIRLANEEAIVIPQEGTDGIAVQFNASVDWTAAVKNASDGLAVVVTPKSGSAGDARVTIVADKNETNDNLTATLEIKAGTAVKELSITQLQKDAVSADFQKLYEVPVEGQVITFKVAHNIEFSAESDAPEWIQKVESKTMSETEVSFNVMANTGAAREGKIIVKAAGLPDAVATVKQAAWVPSMEVSAEAFNFTVAGGTEEFTVTSNVEYDVTVEENDWLTISAGENGKYSVSALENKGFEARDVKITVTPKDETLAEFVTVIRASQEGLAKDLWHKSVTSYDGFSAGSGLKLAKFGEYLLVLNGDKIFVVNAATGEFVLKYDLPQAMQSLCVDEGGNVILANDAATEETVTIYKADLATMSLEKLIEYPASNYYCVDAGNVRVKGDITKNAVITVSVSDGAGGALSYWEVKDGVIGDWQWVNIPYAGSSVQYEVSVPAGTSVSDGFFFIGYQGDYNLKYLADPVKGGNNEWVTSYVTGSSWMENYNCLSTASYNGRKYLAYVMGCHFGYDNTDVVLLDVTDPANATLVYQFDGEMYVTRNDDWSNADWTGAGAYSDVVLSAEEDGVAIWYADSNFNIIGCHTVKL